MPSPRKTPNAVYLLKLWLRELDPLIWRRIEVPSVITLPKLHRVIQIVMGWEDYHLHQFQVGRQRYDIPDPEDLYGSKAMDERRVKLNKVVKDVGTAFGYLYDFGDGWAHDLRLEAIKLAESDIFYPRCLEGARSGPPEDVGGPYSYGEYLHAIALPKHKRHQELLEWRGRFDAERFDLAVVNRALVKEFAARGRRSAGSSQ